jgi:hypothetical protein
VAAAAVAAPKTGAGAGADADDTDAAADELPEEELGEDAAAVCASAIVSLFAGVCSARTGASWQRV